MERAEASTKQVSEPSRMLLGSVLVLGHAVKHVFNSGLFIILPELQIHLGLSNAAVGTLSTIRNAGSGLANLPAGYMADRFSSRWRTILAVSITLVGVFHMLMGSVSAYWLLVVNATVAGVAISFWHPPAIAALSQRFPRRRGFAISLHGMGGSIGEALGPLLVGSLLTVVLWRTVLQGGVVPAVITGVVVWLVLRNLQGRYTTSLSFQAYLQILLGMLRQRALLTVLIVTAGFSAAQGVTMTFLPIYLRVELEFSSFLTAVFISGSQVVGIGTQPVLGFLSDKYSRKLVIIPSLTTLGLITLTIPFAGSGALLFLAVLLMGAFSFALMSVLIASAMDLVGGEMPATTVSLVFSSSVIFSALSPAIAGILADEVGLTWVFFLAASMVLTVTVFAVARSWSR